MVKSIGPAACLALALAGCAELRPHDPPPQVAEAKAQVPGMPGVRSWGDAFSPEFQRDIIESIRQEERSGLFKENEAMSILALSGGGR